MFTPLRKGWASLAPKSGGSNGSRDGEVLEKGKSVAQSVGGENGSEVEAWNRFRDAGMLDESVLEAKDKEALVERMTKLENELYDYQYNMGLLLIEKKSWASKCNEFQEALIEFKEALKREKAANLIAISETEKREENLKKALSVEKQCVTELEKVLHEMRSQHADMKVTADSKLVEAHTLKEELEEKSFEVYAKICSADARLAEISRKNSDVDRKLQELASRESMLQRERQSINYEKELNAEDLARQKEDLQTWEKRLHEGQERLVESQNLISQREKRTTESDKVLLTKEKELEMLRETVEKAKNSLREKEDYINIRLTALTAKEKEAELQMENLQKIEKELLSKEEHLDAREKVEIEKIVGDQMAMLASKRAEFELEVSKKRKSMDEELKTKLIDVEKKEKIIRLREEKLLKREQAMEKKIEKLNHDKSNLDVKEERLNKLEESLKLESFEIDKKNKQLMEENQRLLMSRGEIDVERDAIKAEKIYLISEQEKLKITEQERENHCKLQSKLKQEIDEYMILKELLAKEREELREERKKFEREWEALDEKRSTLSVDERRVTDEKIALEKWKRAEELRLKTEQQVTRDKMQRELDDLRLKKEAFEANMAHDKSELVEKLRQERAEMVQELDRRKHELEIDMQTKLQNLENRYQQKESELNDQTITEMDHIKSLRDLAASEMQKMKVEQAGLQREKEEYLTQRKKLKQDQLELQNDIEVLHNLNRNLKHQREEFLRARKSFLSQNCCICGARAEVVFPATEPSDEIGALSDIPLPSLSVGSPYQYAISPLINGSQSSGAENRMSWLKACTKKIFTLSPLKRAENSVGITADGSNTLVTREENETSPNKKDELAKSDDLIGPAGSSDRNNPAAKDSVTSHDLLENSIGINSIDADNGTEECNVGTFDRQNELSLSPLFEEGSEPHQSRHDVQLPRRRGKSKAVRRTKSVKAVVEESKRFLKEPNDGIGQDSVNTHENHGDSVDTGKTTSVGRKRKFSGTSETAANEIDADSESQSESVSIGGSRKRRQRIPEAQATGGKRYNFRRTTVTKGVKTKKLSKPHANDQSHNILDEKTESPKRDQTGPTAASEENDTNVHMFQSSKSVCVDEIHPSSLDKIEQVQEEIARSENDTQHSGQIVEINGNESPTALAGQEDESYKTEEGKESDDEDDGDDLDAEEHNASVGKKLWKFLMS